MTAKCETCSMRMKAEKNPNALLSRIWRWHTGWYPEYKKYQKEQSNKK